MSDDNDRDEREEIELNDEEPQTRQVVTQKKAAPADRSEEYYGYMGAFTEND